MSAINCISICLGAATYFSINTLSSPNELKASLWAMCICGSNSSIPLTILIPFPPPPALALINTGKPICTATSLAASMSVMASFSPGTKGTPNFSTACLLAILLPIKSILSADGPTKMMPASANLMANSDRSLKNPYPGCTASTLWVLQISIILSANK